jgi:hypothetical protein
MRSVLMRSRIFDDQSFGNAFLHQQARTRAAHLSLVEPDSVDQAFDRAVEIGIFENNERRFPSQFEREAFVACSRRAADRASNFGGSGERDLVDVRMLHQRLAGRAVSGHDVDDSRGQSRFLAKFGEQERSERGKFGGLQHHRVSRRQSRSDLPRQH